LKPVEGLTGTTSWLCQRCRDDDCSAQQPRCWSSLVTPLARSSSSTSTSLPARPAPNPIADGLAGRDIDSNATAAYQMTARRHMGARRSTNQCCAGQRPWRPPHRPPIPSFFLAYQTGRADRDTINASLGDGLCVSYPFELPMAWDPEWPLAPSCIICWWRRQKPAAMTR
jgi:hypothetical protein